MLSIKPALQDFPSDSVRYQFDKVFSGSNYVPTSQKIHELRTRHEELHAETISSIEENPDQIG